LVVVALVVSGERRRRLLRRRMRVVMLRRKRSRCEVDESRQMVVDGSCLVEVVNLRIVENYQSSLFAYMAISMKIS